MNKDKISIAFDVDDVLWPLNKFLCEKYHIPFDVITQFNITKVKELSQEQVELLMSGYANPDIFKQLEFSRGAMSLKTLIENGIDLSIYTHSLNSDVANVKMERLTSELYIPEERIFCSIIEKNGVHTKKQLPSNLDYFADDSPYNIATSPAKRNFVVMQPWNTSAYGREIMRDARYDYFEDLSTLTAYLCAKLL